jgi:catechol-2,3-dioxygenase
MQKLITFLFLTVVLFSCKTDKSTDMTTVKDSNKQGGIVFLRTQELDSVSEFYTKRIGCELWLDQGNCKILKHGNMLFGFCQSDQIDKEGVITFFYPEKSTVDSMYNKMENLADSQPKMNPRFNIYHFYAKDPEGRSIEFQYFNHELKDY